MQVSILTLPKGASRWNLVTQFLRERKRVFVDRLDWQLHHAAAMEYEQYDDPATVYVIAHEADTVLGGARLVRTDRSFGIYSYMIRDAYRKQLPGLPSELCHTAPPVDPKVWELTRFVSLNNVQVGAAILRAADDWLGQQAATQCLFLGPPAFMRMAKKMGYNPIPMGAVVGNQDGRFLAFSCNVSAAQTDKSVA